MSVNKAVIINGIKMADAAVMEMFYNVPTMTSDITKNGCIAVYFTANNYIVVFFCVIEDNN